jgi:hypothetical protein
MAVKTAVRIENQKLQTLNATATAATAMRIMTTPITMKSTAAQSGVGGV